MVMLDEIFELEQQKKYDEIIKLGEDLLNSGLYDKSVYMLLGKSYFYLSRTSDAILMFNNALNAEYYCFKPSSKRMIERDDALLHYMISEVYDYIGDSKRSKSQYTAAEEKIKKSLGTNYNSERMLKIFKSHSLIKNE